MNFEDFSVLDQFAKQCARAYCAKYSSKDIDDAYSEIVLYIYEHISDWSKPRNWWRKRVIGELVSSYRKEKGLRLANRPQLISLTDVEDASSQETSERDSVREHLALEQALTKFNARDLEVLTAILAGERKKDVAHRFGISPARVSQIYRRLQQEIVRCYYAPRGCGVVVVETLDTEVSWEEQSATPLFFGGLNAN